MIKATYMQHLLACARCGETPLDREVWLEQQKKWLAQRAQINAIHKLED